MYLRLLIIGVAVFLSTWLAVMSTALQVDLFVTRITRAIREQEVKWKHGFDTLAVAYALLVLSVLAVVVEVVYQ